MGAMHKNDMNCSSPSNPMPQPHDADPQRPRPHEKLKAAAKQHAMLDQQDARKGVYAVSIVGWLIVSIGSFVYAKPIIPWGFPVWMRHFTFVPTSVLAGLFIYVIGLYVHQGTSFRSFFRFTGTNADVHKAAFDFLKNAAVPAAAVAIVGRGIFFMASKGVNYIPAQIEPFLPPESSVILWVFLIITYFACGILYVFAIRQLKIAMRKAADDHLQKLFDPSNKNKVDPILRRYFRRKVGINVYMSILSFVSLVIFCSGFIYSFMGLPGAL